MNAEALVEGGSMLNVRTKMTGDVGQWFCQQKMLLSNGTKKRHKKSGSGHTCSLFSCLSEDEA